MREAPKYILAYLLWAVSIALGLVAALMVRQAVSGMFGMALLNAAPDREFSLRMQGNAVDRFGVVILGVVLMILIIAAEHLYRTGVQKRKLTRYFFQITAIELAVMLVANTLLLSQSLQAGLPASGNLTVEVILLVLLALSVWLYRRQKTRPLLPV